MNRGTGGSVAWTNSASEVPRSWKEAWSPRLFSSATCTTLSGVSGPLRSLATSRLAIAASASPDTLDTALPSSAVAIDCTAPMPPSGERDAHPARAKPTQAGPSTDARRRAAVLGRRDTAPEVVVGGALTWASRLTGRPRRARPAARRRG